MKAHRLNDRRPRTPGLMHEKIGRKARLTAGRTSPGSDSSLVAPQPLAFFVLVGFSRDEHPQGGLAGCRRHALSRNPPPPRRLISFRADFTRPGLRGGVSLHFYIYAIRVQQPWLGVCLGLAAWHPLVFLEKVGQLTSSAAACPFPINRFPRGMSQTTIGGQKNHEEEKGREGWEEESHQQYGPAFAQEEFAAIRAAASSPVRLLPLTNRGASIPEEASKIPSTWWSV